MNRQVSPLALELAAHIEVLVRAEVGLLRSELMREIEAQRAAPAPDPDQELSTAEAARLAGLQRRTLEWYRQKGGGPRFTRHGRANGPGGRVTYRRGDVLAWLESKKRRNTNVAVGEGGVPS